LPAFFLAGIRRAFEIVAPAVFAFLASPAFLTAFFVAVWRRRRVRLAERCDEGGFVV